LAGKCGRHAWDIPERRQVDLDAGAEPLIANETLTSELFAPLLGKRSGESNPVAA